jgi:hypothetical protein
MVNKKYYLIISKIPTCRAGNLLFSQMCVTLVLYPCKNINPNPKKVSPMKTQLHVEATPVVSRTIAKLALLGGVTLGLVYVILMVFMNAVKIFE